MIRIKIDKQEVEVKAGTRVIEAIRSIGTEIPAMCYLEGTDHFTSCMVCMVKDAKTGRLYPSCSYKVEEGMEVITGDEEVRTSRQMALELLLSEHVGDCEAPCQITCPAHMNIPLMNRLLAKGQFEEALRVVKRDIALPSVFGRICPAPCEGACRRKSIDAPVSICLLKRFAGDHNLQGDSAFIPEVEKDKKKSVAIIGAGPAGLSAAYYLRLRGYSVIVFDRNEKAGGSMRKEVDAIVLPMEVLDREIDIIEKMGVSLEIGKKVDKPLFEILEREFDAIVIATGKDLDSPREWGFKTGEKGIVSATDNYRVGSTKIFAAGSALRTTKLAIRALGQGKELAFSIDQYLRSKKVTGEPFMFNSRFGKLYADEFEEYLKESVPYSRVEPDDLAGFNRDEVVREALRCLHCDCRDLETCKLRIYSDQYDASQKHFSSEQRKGVTKKMQHDLVIYEPSKCIKCGICVRMTSEYSEEFGLTFIGRGFDVVVGIPFDESLEKGLKKVALEVADACPTGAISRRDNL